MRQRNGKATIGYSSVTTPYGTQGFITIGAALVMIARVSAAIVASIGWLGASCSGCECPTTDAPEYPWLGRAEAAVSDGRPRLPEHEVACDHPEHHQHDAAANDVSENAPEVAHRVLIPFFIEDAI